MRKRTSLQLVLGGSGGAADDGVIVVPDTEEEQEAVAAAAATQHAQQVGVNPRRGLFHAAPIAKGWQGGVLHVSKLSGCWWYELACACACCSLTAAQAACACCVQQRQQKQVRRSGGAVPEQAGVEAARSGADGSGSGRGSEKEGGEGSDSEGGSDDDSVSDMSLAEHFKCGNIKGAPLGDQPLPLCCCPSRACCGDVLRLLRAPPAHSSAAGRLLHCPEAWQLRQRSAFQFQTPTCMSFAFSHCCLCIPRMPYAHPSAGAKVTSGSKEVSLFVQLADGTKILVPTSRVLAMARKDCPGCQVLTKLTQFYESKSTGVSRPKTLRGAA